MASGITASRLALGAAILAGGLRPAYDPGAVQPPGVLVAPADPWVIQTGLATFAQALRWRVVAVAGKADQGVTVSELEDLVASLIAALANLPDGWGTVEFDAPGTVDLAGANYLAAVGRLSHTTEV